MRPAHINVNDMVRYDTAYGERLYGRVMEFVGEKPRIRVRFGHLSGHSFVRTVSPEKLTVIAETT